MKRTLISAIALGACIASASAERIALTGATIVNPATNQVSPDSVVVIDDGKIVSAGTDQNAAKGAKTIDCKGKFILPGYIDTHVHFFQSGDIYTRPDAVDLNTVRSYKDEHAWIEKNLPDVFARYLRCGITSVVD